MSRKCLPIYFSDLLSRCVYKNTLLTMQNGSRLLEQTVMHISVDITIFHVSALLLFIQFMYCCTTVCIFLEIIFTNFLLAAVLSILQILSLKYYTSKKQLPILFSKCVTTFWTYSTSSQKYKTKTFNLFCQRMYEKKNQLFCQ